MSHVKEQPRKLARVLYLTDLHPSDKFGSLEEQIFVIARMFKENGGLFVPVFGGPLGKLTTQQYSDAGLRVNWLNLHELSLQTLRRLLMLIRKHKVEVVHWNFYSPINPYVWLLSLLAPGLCHYLTDHTSRVLPLAPPPRGIKKMLKRILFKRYRKVLCISDFVMRCLVLQDIWSNVSRCTYFINTDRFRPIEDVRVATRTRLGVTDEFAVLFVANIMRWKGADVAVRALAELPNSVVLWVVGDGEELTSVRQLSGALKLDGRVRFLGNQRSVEPFMQAADCFVCPSLWGEATGLVNLEALACRLPVVASAIGGIPEFVEEGRTGLLFSPGDHRELATKIRQLASNPEDCKRMGEAARLAAVEKYSIESRLSDYVEVYISQ